jgi:hypothetical protein
MPTPVWSCISRCCSKTSRVTASRVTVFNAAQGGAQDCQLAVAAMTTAARLPGPGLRDSDVGCGLAPAIGFATVGDYSRPNTW